MKRWIKTLLWIVGIVAALMLAVSLVAGPVAKGYINKHGERLVGRKVTVGNVGLNLFSGHLYVRDAQVYEDDGTNVFAGFDTLDLRLHLLALPFRTVNLRHFTLSGLHANLLQQGEQFNFSSILDHFKSDDSDKDTTPSRWVLKMHNLRLSHARLYYNDLLSRKELSLPDINLRVPGFTIGGKEQSEGGLSLGFADGGTLNINAHYDATLERYDMQATLSDFALKNVQELVADMLNIDRLHGTMQATLRADGETAHLLNSRLGGTIAVEELAVHTDRTELASMNRLEVAINSINLEKKSFNLQSIALDGLAVRYEQWADHNTLDDLLPKKADTAQADTVAAAPAKKSTPLSLQVTDLQVSNCSLNYIDHSLPDPFEFPVSGIALSATNLSTRGSNNARLRATLPGGGHLALRWQGMLGEWKQFQELFLTVKGLDMKQLNPLLVAYTGRPLDDGIFGLTTRLAIDNSQLQNDNKLDIYKAVVGKKRKDVKPEMNIPLKTALYILKDKDDKIMIDLPVSGNIDNPEFNYMKVVWKTLGNLLVKVATSPVRALGNALGVGGESLEFFAVGPEQHTLTSEQYHTLATLADIAKQNNQIHITMSRPAAAESDSTSAARIDRQIALYMSEHGLDTSRFTIISDGPADEKGRKGYAISSEMTIEEE